MPPSSDEETHNAPASPSPKDYARIKETYSSSGSVECRFRRTSGGGSLALALSGELTAVVSDPYDGVRECRSSSNRMDLAVLLLALPPVFVDFRVLDRLTCPFLSRRVLDRLTPELDRLTVPLPLPLPLATPPSSSLICLRLLTEDRVPLRFRVPAVGSSNENAVLLLLRPCPATIGMFLAWDTCVISDRCEPARDPVRWDMALCMLECRIGLRPVLRSRRLAQQQPIPACRMKPMRAKPVAIHINANIR